MRFYFLVALLALIAGLCSASDFSDCWAKNKNIISAINNFCGWTYDLTVPSYKASQGAYGNGNNVKVLVRGNCNPPQWVPRQYCLSQMWKTCANNVRAGRNGFGDMKFGRNGCQLFRIART